MEIVIIIILSLILIPIVVFTEGVVRIILSLLFLFFFPGYSLIVAMFPKKDSLNAIERIALSFIISAAVVALIGIILNYIWEISVYPVITLIYVFTLVASTVALIRRFSLPKAERYTVGFGIEIPQLNRIGPLGYILSFILVISILITIGSAVYLISNPYKEEKYTEFYFLDSEEQLGYYVQQLLDGDELKVTLVVVNHEHEDTSYYLETSTDDSILQKTGLITLAHEQQYEEMLTILPSEIGESQIIYFSLFREQGLEPYRSLQLVVNIGTEK